MNKIIFNQIKQWDNDKEGSYVNIVSDEPLFSTKSNIIKDGAK